MRWVKSILIFSIFSLPVDADLTLTDLVNKDVLCQSGLNLNNRCNTLRYAPGMKVDTKTTLVKCDATKAEKCTYLNNDNSTVVYDCECAFNEAGSSFCRAAQFESNFFDKHPIR